METTSVPPLSEAFTTVLKTERESFNARFAERRFAGSRIDGGAFLDHLANVVDPIVRTVAERFPDRARVAIQQLYDLSLNLFAASLLGPTARMPQVDAVWRRLLPVLGGFVAREPARLAGSLSNAAYNIAVQAETRT